MIMNANRIHLKVLYIFSIILDMNIFFLLLLLLNTILRLQLIFTQDDF